MLTKSLKFKAFCYYYLSDYIQFPFSSMHDEWFTFLEQRRVAIAAPRSFAKSHIFSFFFPLFIALEEPTEILLISATASLAEKFLGLIKKELMTNTALIEDYGQQQGDKWANDVIHLVNGSKIMAKGAESQIRGFRPHVIIVDDLESDEAVYNEDRRRNLKTWYLKALVGTLEANDQLVIVGTILHPFSLLSEIINNPQDELYTKGKYKALKDDGKSVWEDKWPTCKLIQRRDEIGTAAFEQEYQNNPIPDEWRIFKPSSIRIYEELPKGLTYSTTVDPALTIGENSDYTAIITVGTDSDKNMYVAEVVRKKMLPDELVEEIFRVNKRWSPHTIGLETVAFQKLIKYRLDEECLKRHEFPYIKELKLDVSERGRKKRFRIEALQPYFEQGRIYIGKSHKELLDELVSYPGKHDDMVDALASQLEIIRPAKEETSKEIPPDSFLGNLLEKKKLSKSLRRVKPWQSRHAKWC